MSVATCIILDTRRLKENNKYPIKLRVNYQRVTNYYPTIYDLSQEDYDKLSASRLSASLQSIKNDIKAIEHDAAEVADSMHPFSFPEFERRYIIANRLFRQKKRKTEPIVDSVIKVDDFDFVPYHKKFPILLRTDCEQGTIAWSYLVYIKRLIKEGRISTAVNYQDSHNSLRKFRGNIRFDEITVSYLISYEQQLKAEGKSKSTIGIYLRPLRAVYNEAAEAGLAKKDKSYPFGRRRYQIPSSKKVKKALELSDLEKIYYYDEKMLSQSEQWCRDLWLFSYFANGMNPKDIANLRYSNIQDGYLLFERAKTERSLREDPKVITIYVSEDMQAIMERWSNKPELPNQYIFPILEANLSPLRQYVLVQNVVGLINDTMRRILSDLGIEKKATTYVARHTFSTVLKRSGASTEQIQEALGHTDIKTTESYLDSFDRETKKVLASQLISFKR